MNGAQTIIDTILENARDDAAHTLAQARDKAKKLHDAAEEGAKNRLDAALERAESDAARCAWSSWSCARRSWASSGS